jgi:hypothetical protein
MGFHLKIPLISFLSISFLGDHQLDLNICGSCFFLHTVHNVLYGLAIELI